MRTTRSLKTNKALLRKAVEEGKVGFARDVGVHLTTLNALLNDSWDRIERDTIERICDRLNCDLPELFSLAPDRFWQPFLQAMSYRVLRGVTRTKKIKLPMEEQAKTSVINFLQGHLPRVAGGFAEDLKDEEEIVDYARDNNCIVIGTHHSNPACEVLLSRHFGAKPFDARPDNRRKVPFRLVKPDFKRRSAFIESASADSQSLGIYSEEAGRLIVRTTRLPEEEYFEAQIRGGHDAAIVLVVNKPFQTTKNVKMIVLAGFTRIGTLAAAHALARHYRDLEPTEPGNYTIGILDVEFDKAASGDDRQITGSRWASLKGGRRTVLSKEEE